MTKINNNLWQHKSYKITKRDGWYVAEKEWNTMIRPLMADTLEGMKQLINKKQA